MEDIIGVLIELVIELVWAFLSEGWLDASWKPEWNDHIVVRSIFWAAGGIVLGAVVSAIHPAGFIANHELRLVFLLLAPALSALLAVAVIRWRSARRRASGAMEFCCVFSFLFAFAALRFIVGNAVG